MTRSYCLKLIVVVMLFANCVESRFNIRVNNGLSSAVTKLSEDFWNWRVQDMPQFATFVGIHDYDEYLDDLSEEAYFARYNKCHEFLRSAEELEPTLSDSDDIINIKVLKYELNTFIGSYDLKGFYLPVNYLEGPQVDMENLFGWMVRNNTDDYDIVLKRMKNLPKQINQMITLMKNGVKFGITYHQRSLKNLNKSLSRFVVEDPSKSPFFAFFNGKDFPRDFSKQMIEDIQNRAQEIITKEVTPAYKRLRDYFEKGYVPRKHIAITSITNGEKFYKNAIWFSTSQNISVEEIQQIGFNEVDRIEKEMEKIVKETGHEGMTTSEFSEMLRGDSKNFYNSSENLMSGFENIVQNVIPPRIPSIFKNIPKAQLIMAESANPDSPGCYYLAASYDGSRPGVFYVNDRNPALTAKYSMMTLSLHEGNPGHHLQTSHSIESQEFPFFRRAQDDRNYGLTPSRFPLYTYYVEGWALYSEKLGFDMDLYNDPLDRYGHYSDEVFRACRLIVDAGMHALGWTREQAIEYMVEHTASTKTDLENEVDRYITWPGQALAYKLGELKLSSLRSEAEQQLGSKFDLKDFHDVILDAFGPMDLVEEQVRLWISKQLEIN